MHKYGKQVHISCEACDPNHGSDPVKLLLLQIFISLAILPNSFAVQTERFQTDVQIDWRVNLTKIT